MIKKRKFLLISLVAVCVFLVGCGEKSETKDGKYSKVVYNKAAAKGDIKKNKITNEAVLMTVGDVDVTYSEAMIYMLSMKQEYETMFSNNVWSYSFDNYVKEDDASFEALAKESIIKQISMLKIVEQEAKKELNVELNRAEEVEARDAAVEYLTKISINDQEKYGITEEIATKFFKDNALASKTYEYLTMDIQEVTQEEARVVVLKQIEVLYGKNGKTKKEAQKKIEQIYEKLDGTDSNFTKTALELSEDDNIEITVKRGEKEKLYEEAAYTLKKNQLSGIIETETGFYILYCVVENDEEKTKINLEDMNKERLSNKFIAEYNEWIKRYDLYVVSELWNIISFSEI